MSGEKKIRLTVLLVVVSFCLLSQIHAQTGESSTPVLKANAANDYNKGSYSEALEKYELLLGRYPKDGAFNYYAGLCLYHLNKELPRAAGMLEFAASRPDVPADAWYYLGRIYMKMYRFKEAGSGFDKFRETASRQDIKAFDAEQWSGHAANALEFTGSYNAYDLKASSSFSFRDTSYLVQIFSTGGRLVKKPGDLVTPGEEDESYTRYMFIPRVLNNGDYVYFSGYSRGKKGGADLFRAKYINAKRWGNIETINSLNTSHDELLPYFDPVGNDLYFATQGYSSMGGLDVFKSHYDAERNVWSEPRNLGFPLNSPFNDLLVLPGPDLGTLILVSGRMGDDKIYTVHSLHLREPKKILVSADDKELKRIANFGAVEIPAYADISNSFKKESATRTHESDTIASASGLNEINELPVAYNKNLKEALSYQFKSDSLASLARESRLMAKEIADPAERWNLQKKILEWEKESKDYQVKADELYRQVKETESGRKQADLLPVASAGIEDTAGKVLEDPKQDVKKAPVFPLPAEEMKPSEVKAEEKAIRGEPGEELQSSPVKEDNMNRFVILDKSPYSAANPFPENVVIPGGPFYAIQLGVFSQKVDYDAFGGLTPITGEAVPGKNMTRYYAGKFNRYEQASGALEIVKKRGYNDAFIVAWFNGQKMPPARVQELEKRGD